MEYDMILLSALIPAIIVLLTMCLLSCLRCGRRNNPVIRRSVAAHSTVYTVPNYSAVNSNSSSTPRQTVPSASDSRSFGHHRISSMGDRFAVPLDLLPPNFDFNAPGVEHKGDHVLMKDLRLIHIPTTDEYQKQSAYNPNFA